MNNFATCLHFSHSHSNDDILILQELFGKNAKIELADLSLDKRGADFIVNGNTYIDVKRRRKGCSQQWRKKNDPELALELRSSQNKVGSLFNPHYITTYLLYVFDSSDCESVVMIGYRKLREVAKQNLNFWIKYYSKTQPNTNNGVVYQSQCLFVPLSEILRAYCLSNKQMVIN